ncbi:MAG: hypothetical protein V4543_17575 [Bacteroidota bacterium]
MRYFSTSLIYCLALCLTVLVNGNAAYSQGSIGNPALPDSVKADSAGKGTDTRFKPLGKSHSGFSFSSGASLLNNASGLKTNFNNQVKDADLGSGLHALGAFGAFRVNAKGVFMSLEIEALIRNSTTNFSGGASFLSKIGYEVCKNKWSLTPNMGFGISSVNTHIVNFETPDYMVDHTVIFIGPDNTNKGRGYGENINMSIRTDTWILRPGLRAGYTFSTFGLFADIFYNVPLTNGNPAVTLVGRGYYSDIYYQGAYDPKPVTVKYDYNAETTPFYKSNGLKNSELPVKISGPGIAVGIYVKL